MSHDMTHYQYHYGQAVPPDIDITGSSSGPRAKSVVIPNVGAFAGFSYRLPAAKVSIGSRAAMSFNGVDGGLSTANRIDHAFYGPFATISFGLGD